MDTRIAPTLYGLTIVVSLVAIAFALTHSVTELVRKKQVSVTLAVSHASLAMVAMICVFYLWDKPMARYANMVYSVGWLLCASLNFATL